MAFYKLSADQFIDQLFKLSPQVRYAAICQDDKVSLRQRKDIENASAAETEHYEELLVNPALLTMLTHRGNIDCGGFHYVLIRYGHFFQFVRNIQDGHVSIGLDANENIMKLVDELDTLVKDIM